MTGADPFETAALRRAVLDGWTASVHRFREDANAEESLAVGGYADRVLIELIANAVDAARQAGEPARVLVRWLPTAVGAELRVANNGAPLTAAGVAGLATLRASAKRENTDAVGHFGVGFTAVLAVTDAPVIVSTTGAVAFDRVATASALADLGLPDLTAEVVARSGQVPALRLPWPMAADTAGPPTGYTTEVRLPVTGQALQRARRALHDAGPALFWALPGLAELDIDTPDRPRRQWRRTEETGYTVLDDGSDRLRFRIVTTSGTVPAELLADRPVEERRRDRWRISWIQPVTDELDPIGGRPDPGQSIRYLGAPTATDEEISLPADVVGTFPVDDTRRRLAAGPLTDHLLRQAARCYLDLVMSAPVAERIALVPSAGFPLGPIDAVLRAEVLSGLAAAPMLRTAAGEPVAAADACILPGVGEQAAALLSEAVPGLLPSVGRTSDLDALRLLGVRQIPVSEGVSALAGLDRAPEFWWQVYESLMDRPADDLADLPVPLAGGGRRIGVRGCLLPGPGAVSPELIERACAIAPTLPVVHPDAAHPLLDRLGAEAADADALLSAPALEQVFAEFRESLDDRDPDPDELIDLATLALDLVLAGGRSGPVLAQVVLTDSGGEAWPASELLAPGAPLAAVLAPDADLPIVGDRWFRDYPADVLAAVGVRTGLRVITVTGPSGPDADLPDLEEWWSSEIGDTPPPEAYTAVADLDLIDDEAWPTVLAMIAADRDARDSLVAADGLSYTGWWLSRFAEIGGQRLSGWRTGEASDLAGLYDELPIALDAAVAAAVGVLTGLEEAIRRDPGELLQRYADPARRWPSTSVVALTGRLARALRDDPELQLPERVRTIVGLVVEPDQAMVLDRPWLAQVIAAEVVVPGGADPILVADAFELELTSETWGGTVARGTPGPLDADRVATAAQALGLPADRLALSCFPDLTVQVGGASQRVQWWVEDDEVLVDGSPAGIGRAIAHLAGRWADRHLATAIASADAPALAEFGH